MTVRRSAGFESDGGSGIASIACGLLLELVVMLGLRAHACQQARGRPVLLPSDANSAVRHPQSGMHRQMSMTTGTFQCHARLGLASLGRSTASQVLQCAALSILWSTRIRHIAPTHQGVLQTARVTDHALGENTR